MNGDGIQKLWGASKAFFFMGEKGGGGGFVFVYVSRVGGYSLNNYGVMIVVVRGATRVDGQSKHTDQDLVEVYASISSSLSH